MLLIYFLATILFGTKSGSDSAIIPTLTDYIGSGAIKKKRLLWLFRVSENNLNVHPNNSIGYPEMQN
jgi:hypothetical protein